MKKINLFKTLSKRQANADINSEGVLTKIETKNSVQKRFTACTVSMPYLKGKIYQCHQK